MHQNCSLCSRDSSRAADAYKIFIDSHLGLVEHEELRSVVLPVLHRRRASRHAAAATKEGREEDRDAENADHQLGKSRQ